MSGLLRYLAGYVVDSFRERLEIDELRPEQVHRVRVVGDADEELRALVARMFPGAEAVSGPAEIVVVPMGGGALGPRLWALLGRARHKLLVPSPHYVYRFGMRQGPLALFWALTDRLLLAPAALLWLGVTAGWMSLTGLMRAAREGPAGPPGRVLVIQLVPTPVLVEMLRHLRQTWPAARFAVLTASSGSATELAAAASEVLSTAGLGATEIIRRVRRLAPEVAVLAGGADYGLGPTYLKAVALARLSRAPCRRQWEAGEALGRPLSSGLVSAVTRPVRRRWARSGAPAWRSLIQRQDRRYHRRPPTRGPRLVQIGITEACNYHCIMCAYHNPAIDGKHKESELPRMPREMFVRLIRQLRRKGLQAIEMTGRGEPLTHPQATEMVEEALRLGVHVTLKTNGSLLTDAQARRFVDLRLPRLHVSLNAATDEKYAQMHPGTPQGRLKDIVSRLRRMAEYADDTGQPRVGVEVSAVITRANMEQLPAMVQVAHEARASDLALIVMGPAEGQRELMPRPEDWPAIARAVREARELARPLGIHVLPEELEATATERTTRNVYEHLPCYMGHEFALVLENGDVWFCAHCYQPMGNLHERDFLSIWRSKPYQEARRAAKALPETKRQLESCYCFRVCCHLAANVAVHRRLYGEAAVEAFV